jgi:hypothetical protein
MVWKLPVSSAALALALLGGPQATAADVPRGEDTLLLKRTASEDPDLVPASWRGGYGGHHGGYGGYHGGYRGGYYGGYRGYYGGGFYSPYYRHHHGYYPFFGYGLGLGLGLGYYQPWYSSAYYWPSSYASVYSYSPVIVGYSPPYPLSVSTETVMPYAEAPAVGSITTRPPIPAGERVPSPQPLPDNRSYPYDGGPRKAVPMQPPEVDSLSAPRPRTVPLEGKPVALPARKPVKYEFPAYGEEPGRKTLPADPAVRVEVAKKASR